tara:strand:- start:2726 stop:3259 length:534 start_codon:yes stop_codon:yes gene_type:complete
MLLILDVDGVLTDGTKVYDSEHNVLSKRYMCKDFTAIKRFIAAGVNVVFLSGDIFNKTMAEKRNIDFYCSRGEDLSLDKSRFISQFEQKYSTPVDEMIFVGDDYFDLSIIKSLKYAYCPSDAPRSVKRECTAVLKSKGGEGVVVELYDLMSGVLFEDADEESVTSLDKQEVSSKEMS